MKIDKEKERYTDLLVRETDWWKIDRDTMIDCMKQCVNENLDMKARIKKMTAVKKAFD